MNPRETDDAKKNAPIAESPPVIQAETLFAGKREVWIELNGVRYRLRITRREKLILQK